MPEIEFSADCQIQFGRTLVAGGIEVAPLIIHLKPEQDVVINVKYNQPLTKLSGKNEMARRLFPDLFDIDQSEFLTGYLIIVPDEFYNNILPLARWQERKGFKVWVKKTSETGSQRDRIRGYIQNAYQNWSPAPSYVLLVGAINKIPAFPTPGATSCVTDHPYACIDGDDYLADLFVGRLPAANSSELDCIVAKIVNYESNPYIEDTSWFHRALMVGTSYQEGGTPAVTALVTKRRIREQLLNRGFDFVDTVFYPPTASGRGPVDTAVNRGVLFVNGRGWGQTTGWNYPQFQINDVYNLNNGLRLPVITSIYCGTGNYQANPCFGEAWLRAGTPTAPKGGVAFWGSSYSGTSTRWNNCMDYGIYHAIFERGINTLGPAMYYGKLEQMVNFPLPEDSSDLVIYFHVYNLLGDPGLEMWTGLPQEIVVCYPDVYPVGTSSFEVEVRDLSGGPIKGARVCLYKPGEIHMVGKTNVVGKAQFAISTSNPDTIFVTVTGKNLKPHLGYSRGEARGLFVGHLRHSPEKVQPGVTTGVTVTLKNYGTQQSANDIRVVMSAMDSAAIVTDSIRDYGLLNPGEEGTAEPFQVFIAPSCTSKQQLAFQLRIFSGDSLWHSAFTLTVTGPTFEIGHYIVYDANGFLDPGETAELAVMIRNRGDENASNVSGILRSYNPAAITVEDSIGSFGNLVSGDSSINDNDRFRVRADSAIAIGRSFLLSLNLSGAGGFEHRINFPITVGQPVATSPFGPDRYGYWGYDDTDVNCQERPVFDWLEINPSNGGWPGTQVAIGNDRAVPVNLPFTFRFYGRSYQSVSISDNGYIAMGNTWFGDPYNWHIPSAQGPDGLVAVFWDDFRCDTLNPGGVYYYYDEPQHRFIIEWSEVYHIHGFRPPVIAEQQTFQVILYDPRHYPTATGDGPVVCQYLFVQNDDTTWGNSHNYATVGIQSPDRNCGLEWTFAGVYPVAAAEVVPGRAIRFTTNPPDTFTFINENQDPTFRDSFQILPSVTRNGIWLKHGSNVNNGALAVFDVTGRGIRKFVITQLSSGVCKRLWWDLKDERGNLVPAGVYLIRLIGSDTANKVSIEKRLVVLR
ncbi:MAG: C25 family cysteine peptidase [bacterium]